jgi:rubrerythrin
MDLKLTIPFPEDLTKETGWILLDRYLYFIPRLHLHIEQNQTSELGFGDILRTYRTTQSSETEMEKTFEEEFTVVDLRETTRSATLSNDLTKKITAAIAGAAKSPFYEVSANSTASLEQAVRSTLGASVRSSDTVSRREKRTFTISQKIKSGAGELQHAVAGYRKYSQSVYLHYLDYLFVEYKPTAFGLRKKKSNLPRPVAGMHVNRIPLNLPLFKLLYWDLEEESSLLFTESEYASLPKVAHPDRVTFEELQETVKLPLPSSPEHPTLYTLSNIAFPLRWIDRKGPWTREELEKVELEEAEGSAWWYQYGPGRKKG